MLKIEDMKNLEQFSIRIKYNFLDSVRKSRSNTWIKDQSAETIAKAFSGLREIKDLEFWFGFFSFFVILYVNRKTGITDVFLEKISRIFQEFMPRLQKLSLSFW